MKKILYIHQYFTTPSEPGGTRSYWFSKELIKNGYNVTVISSRKNQVNKIEKKIIDGIEVIYIKVGYDNNMGVFKRLISFISFMYLATIEGYKQKNVDLVFATSTPLTIGIPALILRWFKKKPYVFEVRDLWPEVPIQMGALNNGLLQTIAKKLEKTIYVNAKHIIALSPGMEKGVLDVGIKQEKVTMLPNMSKVDMFFPREINKKVVKEYGIDNDKFKIVYFGALGLANAVDFINKTIIETKENHELQWVIVGEGKQYEILENSIKEHELSNLVLLPSKPMAIISEIVNACDASLITFSDFPILNTNSPNKLFDSLSAAKPIIVNSSGWTKDMAEDNNCGIYIRNNDVDDFILKIRYLMDNKDILDEMGRNSLKLALNKYDKSIISKQFISLINDNLL